MRDVTCAISTFATPPLVPLCIIYGIYVQQHGSATPWDWAIGFAYAVFAYVVVFRLIIMKAVEDPHSPYPFDTEEMQRFDRLYRRRG